MVNGRESKQVRAFLTTIRTQNNAISKSLATMIQEIGRIRTIQLGINLVIDEFEKKLGK